MDETKEVRVVARRGTQQPSTTLREYALLAPRLAKLLFRLVRDPRVPAGSKASLFFLLGYLASPIDFMPDIVPGLGQVDDLVLAAFALDQILNRVPDDVVREHWDGDEDVLDIVRHVLAISTSFLPGWLKRVFSRA